MKTFLLELREAARQCSNVDYRVLTMVAADMVEVTLKQLYEDTTRVNAVAFNASWAHAERMLKNMPPEAPPAPLSGSPEPTRFGSVVKGMRKAA